MASPEWTILDSGSHSAQTNMDLDAQLLHELDPNGPAILHLYDWDRPSATYGHFVKPEDFLNMDRLEGLDLGKRPTGGGIVFHIWDYAFSLLVPSGHASFSNNTLENYDLINRGVLRAIEPHLPKPSVLIEEDAKALDSSCKRFCMAQPTKYDVVLNGRKLVGAAQRKTKRGFLHQGTIALEAPDFDYLNRAVRSDTQVVEAMKLHTHALSAPRDQVKQLLIQQFTGHDENSHIPH